MQRTYAATSWRAQRRGAKNLALDFSAEKQQGGMLRCAQHDSEEALSRTS
jgi:hypothetical protein